MSQSSFTINSRSQTVSIDPLSIYGLGDDMNPILRIPFDLDISFPDDYLPIWILSYRTAFSINGIPRSIAEVSSIINWNIFHNDVQKFNADIPLTQQKIERIEKNRNGDLKCVVELNISLGQYENHVGSMGIKIRTLNTFHNERVSINFEIPQSHWVNKILPHLYYKAFQLVELQTSQEIIGDDYKSSLIELELARKFFTNGDYDKCVGHCRSALDPIKNNLDKIKSLIESKSEFTWIKAITTSTSEWFEKISKETHHFTSKPHHIPSTGHFTRNEAEVVYLISIGIIKYASDLKIE